MKRNKAKRNVTKNTNKQKEPQRKIKEAGVTQLLLDFGIEPLTKHSFRDEGGRAAQANGFFVASAVELHPYLWEQIN